MELIESATKSVKFYDPLAHRSFIIPLNLFASSEEILEESGDRLTIEDCEMGWCVLVLKDGSERRARCADFEEVMNALEEYEDELENKKAEPSWLEISNKFSEIAKTFAAFV